MANDIGGGQEQWQYEEKLLTYQEEIIKQLGIIDTTLKGFAAPPAQAAAAGKSAAAQFINFGASTGGGNQAPTGTGPSPSSTLSMGDAKKLMAGLIQNKGLLKNGQMPTNQQIADSVSLSASVGASKSYLEGASP